MHVPVNPLQLRHVIRGISVYYPEAAILGEQNFNIGTGGPLIFFLKILPLPRAIYTCWKKRSGGGGGGGGGNFSSGKNGPRTNFPGPKFQ